MSAPNGPRILDPACDLHRQVHPEQVQDGKPTSQAFLSSHAHGMLLSVADGRKRNAKDAHEFAVAQGLATAGTWTVTVGHVDGEGLSAYEDPITLEIATREGISPDPAHACIDQRQDGAKKAARRLKVHATRTYPT